MIKIEPGNEYARIFINDKEVTGRYTKNFLFHIEKDTIIVSPSDFEPENFDLFNKIKDLHIDTLPDGLEFEINSFAQLEAPCELLPHPFHQVSFIKKNGSFRVRYLAIVDDEYANEWHKKWLAGVFFKEFSSLATNEENANTYHEIDESHWFTVKFIDNESTIINDAFNKTLPILGKLLTETENSLNGIKKYVDLLETWEKNKKKFQRRVLAKNLGDSLMGNIPMFLHTGCRA